MKGQRAQGKPWKPSVQLCFMDLLFPVCSQLGNSRLSFFMSLNISKHAVDGMSEILTTSLEVTREPPGPF